MNPNQTEENLNPIVENSFENLKLDNKPKKTSLLGDIIKFIILVIIIVAPIRIYIAQPFLVKGSSMERAFENNDYLLVNKISYRFHEPERGDVVVFKFPNENERYLIKRIIGLPGETFEMRDGVFYIVNKDYPDGFKLEEPYAEENTIPLNNKVVLKENQYFVMGDNRNKSADSRAWGPLDKSLIVGKPFIRLYPLTQIGISPGKFDLQPEVGSSK